MLSELLNSPLLYSITLTLLHFLWQGGVIACALKIMLMIIPSAKSQLRYALASLAMLLNLLVPLATFYLLLNTHTVLNSQLLEQIVPASQSNFALIGDYWLQTFSLFSPYIALSWLIICGLLTIKLGIGLYQVKRLSLLDTLSPPQKLREEFERLVKQLALKRTPELILSLKTDVPMAIGVIKPIVLMPVSMISGLTPAQLNMLMLHELAHIRRHDYLINIIQTLIETLLFFHPCCFWVSKQVRKEREYCCDDIAVTHCHNPIAYAHTLADTASACHQHRHNIPKMAMAASGGDLKLRVLRLVKNEPSCTSNLYFSKGFALLSILLMGTFLGTQLYLSFSHSQDPTRENTVVNQTEYTAAPTIEKRSRPEVSIPFSTNTFIAGSTLSSHSVNLFSSAYESSLIVSKPLVLIEKNNIDIVKSTIVNKQKSSPITPKVIAKKSLIQPNTKKTISDKPLLNKLVTESENSSITKPIKETYDVAHKDTFKSIIKNTSTIAEAISPEQTETSVNKTSYVSTQKQLLEVFKDTELKSLVQNNALEGDSLEPVQGNYSTERIAAIETEGIMEAKSSAEIIEPTAKQILHAEQIKRIEPKYPAAAKLRGVELDVVVNFTVNTDGKVEDIEFKSQNQSHYFRSSIRSAMKKWRFLPAQKNGKPVESTMTKIFSFNLLT